MTAGTKDFVALLLCGFFLALFQEQVAADGYTDLRKEYEGNRAEYEANRKEYEKNRAEYEANRKEFQEKMKDSRKKQREEYERNRAEYEANRKEYEKSRAEYEANRKEFQEKMKDSRKKHQEDLKKMREELKKNPNNNDFNTHYLYGLPVNKFGQGTSLSFSSSTSFPIAQWTLIQGPAERKIHEAEVKDGIIRYNETETLVIDGKRFHTKRVYNMDTGKFDITSETQDDLAKSASTVCSA